MSIEPGVKQADPGCTARSPGGWWCCLPINHDGNHIGTTQDFGTLYQWPLAGRDE
jgi:hypothetical protein